MIEFVVAALVGALTYVIIEFMRGWGYAKSRELKELQYDLTSLESRFQKLHAKYAMGNFREKRNENIEILKSQLPEVIERLPLPENQKELIRKIPPDLIVSWLKNEKFL